MRLSLIAILIVCPSMSAGTVLAMDTGGTLRGKIFDTTPQRNPLVDVTVDIVGIGLGSGHGIFTVKTDEMGTFEKSRLPAGRYLINIFKEGYNEQGGRTVIVADGGDHYMVHYLQTRMTKEDNLITFLQNNKWPFILVFAAGFVVALILLSLRSMREEKQWHTSL